MTKLIVRFNVGALTARTVEIKRVDLDYFEELETQWKVVLADRAILRCQQVFPGNPFAGS